jgi:hypothetical protein
VSTTAPDVMRLRTDFLSRAVLQVRRMVVQSEFEEVRVAADELRRYFEWVKDEILPAERRQLFEQIQALQRSDLTVHSSLSGRNFVRRLR